MAETKSRSAAGAQIGRCRRIGDYGLIGDCETAALVGRDGSIDWLCWPRFDSEACLAALLGDEGNGFWRIAPCEGELTISRRYRDDTLILETMMETGEGCIRLVDLMPIRGRASDVVRLVEGVSSRVKMRAVLDLRFDYGKLRPLIRCHDNGDISALAGPHAAVLRSEYPLSADGTKIVSNFEIEAGERASFVLSYFPSHLDPPDAVDPDGALEETVHFWSDWTSRCNYEGPYRAQVVRSLVTLKALTYRPTGGTVAAATASVPEAPGGERNWDYRYCWLRDAAFMLLAFVHAGYEEEAAAWRDWLLRAVAGEPSDVRPLYDVAGGQRVFEWTAEWLSGFNGATPVRFGNAAQGQLQIDVFGEVIDAFHLARKHGLEYQEAGWELQCSLLDSLEKLWDQPDRGIWESRGPPRHFVHSKALAWAAFDRAVRDFGHYAKDGDIARWAETRDRIRDQILDQGYDPERESFVQSYGSTSLDAATLLLPIIGFIDASDPRMRGTVLAIERELLRDGLVTRYDTRQSDDGLPPGEGLFLACSFWLADVYHLQGRADEARALFERLAGFANDLGLLSEEYDPGKGMMIGNFPQALSHMALVNTAYNLSDHIGPAEDRGNAGRQA